MNRSPSWYAARLRRMDTAEILGRSIDQARRTAWAPRQVQREDPAHPPRRLRSQRGFASPLPDCARRLIPEPARERVLAAADGLILGQWLLLGTPRPDIADPDWFLDQVTGRRAPDRRLAFRIDHRDESLTGNVKSVWELSRHHHLTLLACAYWLSGEERYAETVARQLRSWWATNPFLSGVHWTNGIELGVRLIGWAWIRRLLDGWDGVADLFERNPVALRQIWWHQRFLAAFPSRGSSANNHLIAEAAGLVVGSYAFPWYAESDRWRAESTERLRQAFAANTFLSGINRELATDYHRFVTELAVLAGAECDAAGADLGPAYWSLVTSCFDAAAALVDGHGRPPRQGDGDDGRGLLVDDPGAEPWSLLLALGAMSVGPQPWWPAAQTGVLPVVVGTLLSPRVVSRERPARRPDAFPDAGLTILRTPVDHGPEIWCRCDGGPHGFLSIAAHAHADALSVELRYDGVELLADPGTYCYHGDPQWRRYFRSTLAHNTVQVEDRDQSVSGGPFLWTRHARTVVNRRDTDGPIQVWAAEHRDYADGASGVRHGRQVELDRDRHRVAIEDTLHGQGQQIRLAFHLGPTVRVRLHGSSALLRWRSEAGTLSAALDLPPGLAWERFHGSTDPVLGWYSPRFGQRLPSTTLIGTGRADGTLRLLTTLDLPAAARELPLPSSARRPVADLASRR